MAISNIVNATRRFLNLRSGERGNNALAILAALNNLVDQFNKADSSVTVYSKYVSGLDTFGTPYEALEATNIINGFLGGNSANKEGGCTGCTKCVRPIGWIGWTGRPCWKKPSGGSDCVECWEAINDLKDGVYDGVNSKVIQVSPLSESGLNSDGPASIVLEATHVPPKITVSFSEDPDNGITGLNNWHFIMWNTDTGAVDYTNIAQVVFKIRYFNSIESFNTPQGYQ